MIRPYSAFIVMCLFVICLFVYKSEFVFFLVRVVTVEFNSLCLEWVLTTIWRA